jgi:hypothetical protein
MNFTFGTDPEFMVTRWEDLQSAIDLLPKKEASLARNGSRFYYDNVLAEIAVKPAKTREEAVANVRTALQNLAKLLKPARFVIRASAKYPVKQLAHKEAKIAGCNPEWDAYSLRCILPPDEIISKTSFRTAGGHIHIGAELFTDPIQSFNAIRMMDLFMAVPALYLDTDESSKERRKVYGHAGSHRTTDYGFEYRALGNFWLSSPDHVRLMYDLTAFIIDFVEHEGHKKFWNFDSSMLESDNPSKAFACTGYDVKLLCKCINTCDKKLADKFMLIVHNYLPDELVHDIERLSGVSLPDPYEAWGIV